MFYLRLEIYWKLVEWFKKKILLQDFIQSPEVYKIFQFSAEDI